MRIINREFLQGNKYKKYPFVDYATFIDKNGKQFPKEFILDIRVLGKSGKVYLDRYEVENNKLIFKDDMDNEYISDVCERKSEIVSYGKNVGVIIVDMNYLPIENFEFNAGDMLLVPKTILILKQTLQSINKMSDEVNIIFDIGTRIRREGGNVIYIDCVGEPYYLLAKCENYQAAKNIITKINGTNISDGKLYFKLCDEDRQPLRITTENNVVKISYIGRTNG